MKSWKLFACKNVVVYKPILQDKEFSRQKHSSAIIVQFCFRSVSRFKILLWCICVSIDKLLVNIITVRFQSWAVDSANVFSGDLWAFQPLIVFMVAGRNVPLFLSETDLVWDMSTLIDE